MCRLPAEIHVGGVSFEIHPFVAESFGEPFDPQRTSTADRVVGSPQAGLTNQQLWDAYGIAVAGAVAPSSATTRNGIGGLVNPI
jgi:hypothetical protein